MKKLTIVFLLFTVSRGWAADGVAMFQSGLKAFQESGPDALMSTWYSSRDDVDKVAAIRAKLTTMTRNLGSVMDTEIFAPCLLGKNVQRLYGVIYFDKRPLWIRADFYSINGHGGFISIDCSLSHDEIFPVGWVASQN